MLAMLSTIAPQMLLQTCLAMRLTSHVMPLQVCDTVSELAATTLASGGSGWPELLPFLSQAVQSGQPRLMEASLLIFAQLAGHMMDTLLQFLGTLLQVCCQRLCLVTLSFRRHRSCRMLRLQ